MMGDESLRDEHGDVCNWRKGSCAGRFDFLIPAPASLPLRLKSVLKCAVAGIGNSPAFAGNLSNPVPASARSRGIPGRRSRMLGSPLLSLREVPEAGKPVADMVPMEDSLPFISFLLDDSRTRVSAMSKREYIRPRQTKIRNLP